jgi:outer membrane lipoprotein-sorting protein
MRIATIVLSVVLAITLVFAAGTLAAPKLIVKGDAKVWAEVSAALAKFAKLKSYRAKGTMPGGGSMTMDVVHPHSFHTRTTMSGTTMETIQVGTEVRFRPAGGKWTCHDQPAAAPNPDPESMTGEVTATRGPAETIDGVRTQSYSYLWKTDANTITTRLFVAATDGLPRRMQILGEGGAVTMTLNYFDFNAPIKIALPSCK